MVFCVFKLGQCRSLVPLCPNTVTHRGFLPFISVCRSDHRQAHRDLRPAAAGGGVPQPGGAGRRAHLRRRVHDRVPSPGDAPGCRRPEDRGLPGHLHRRSDLQRVAGGLRQAARYGRTCRSRPSAGVAWFLPPAFTRHRYAT